MIDFSKAEKITEGSYIYRNFLSDELCQKLYDQSKNSEPEAIHYREADGIYLIGTPVLQECIDQVNNLLKGSGYWTDLYLHWMVPKNYLFYVHRDDENPDYSGYNKEWGGVIYLSDFEGGDLFYPSADKQNDLNTIDPNDIMCHPNRRDMVIHRSDLPHGTRKNLTDDRRTITFVVYNHKKE
jgi:hypothetical protein